MTITVTSIGANTGQVTTSGTNTLADLTDAVAAAVAGTNPVMTSGWGLHDSTYLNSGVTTTVLTQVFKSLNADATTYKYAILRWDTVRQEVNTSCCESWDAITHVPTNECFTYYNCAPITYNLTACDFIVMASPHWLCFTSFSNGEPSLWAGVFETQREDPVDTAEFGMPCFGWIGSTLWMIGAQAHTAKPLAGNDHTLICLPRTRIGNTGINATKGMAADYGVAQVPNWLFPAAVSMPYYMSTAVNKFVYNNWDPTRRLVLPIKPILDYTGVVTNMGQIYGLKILAPSGGNMNKIKASVDADGNFSSAGTLKDHWLLNIHHKSQANVPTELFTNASWQNVSIQAGTGFNPEQLVITGAAYYGTKGTVLFKINALNSTYSAITVAGSPNFYDLKYDGEKYVYIATSLGITRLDITNDSMVNIAITGGIQTIGISTTAIFCSQYAANAAPIVTKILRATFALETGAVGGFTNGVATLTTFTETVKLMDAVTDFSGNVYFAPHVVSGANFKITKITPAGVISYLSTGLANSTMAVGLYILDIGNLLVFQQTTSTQIAHTQIALSTFSAISSTLAITVVGNGAIGTANPRLSIIKIKGCLLVAGRNVTNSIFTIACISLGNSITSTLSTGGSLADPTPAVMGACAINFALWSDGTKIISNMDTGIRIWTKMNNESTITGVQLAQIALPA